MTLSDNRFQQVHKSLTAAAQKVYGAVPIGEAWPHTLIAAELERQGSHMSLHVMRGCLNSLIDAGLVKEPQRGEFQREPIKAPRAQLRAVPVNEKEKPMPTPTQQKDAPAGTLDRLGWIAHQLRAHAAQSESLAKELDDVALAIAEQEQVNAETLAKAEELRKLLRNF